MIAGQDKSLRKVFRFIKRNTKTVLSNRKFSRTRFKFTKRIVSKVVKATPPSKFIPRVLDETHHDPAKQLNIASVVTRIVALAQVLAEKAFYGYQIEFSSRIADSLLSHDGDVITSLMARQMGKTETVGAIVSALVLVLPLLAKQYPNDWHLNITDDKGAYRGFAQGLKVGIYAPKMEQSEIMFERVKKCLSSDSAAKVLTELGIKFDVRNGNKIKLSNGSEILCESASEQSKIEGATHGLLICEECQDISDMKLRKSLHPMVASTKGTMVKIGTASIQKCDFYTSIKNNERSFLEGGKRCHFFYPYTVGIQFNSLYKAYIEKERLRLGENSDEFLTSYCGTWIFERGMFCTPEQLFDNRIAQVTGSFSQTYIERFLAIPRGYSIVVGIDWASSHDSTVLTFVAVDWNNPLETGVTFFNDQEVNYTQYQKHVLGWVEYQGDNYEDQWGEISALLSRVRGLKKIVLDSNACGLPMYHRMERTFSRQGVYVEPFNFQPKVKSDGYKSLYNDICAKRVTFPCSSTVRQTMLWRKFKDQLLDLRKVYKNGLMSVAHPDEKGAHDDFPDSFMLACWGANSPAVGSSIQFAASNPFLS